MKLKPKHTILAGYVGYVTQAITINFAPLLFLTFEKQYGISFTKISLLIAISFITQLFFDVLLAKISKYINTRATIIIGHLSAVLGMTGFLWLPDVLPSAYLGLIICVILAAIGGGIIEVLISPIVEACPVENHSAAMSLLHSFYCWGLAGVVLLSTLFFHFIGIEHWQILAALWGIVPLVGAIAFSIVPLYELEADKEENVKAANGNSVFRSGLFWLFIGMMFCAGASEQAMSQWASTFAESGLHVSKSVGDLLGPLAFALLMGGARVLYAKTSNRINLSRFIAISAALCVAAYLITALSPQPIVSLIGCAVCGLSVGIMWPGTYSLAAKKLPSISVSTFALLAVAGDLGCLVGPTFAGWIADIFGNDLKLSFLICTVFPIFILIFGLWIKAKTKN
jgi:fucose permease